MSDRTAERGLRQALPVARRVWPFLRPYRWQATGVVLFGVLMTLLEGLSIGLFIPFVHSVDDSAFTDGKQRWAVDLLTSLFDGLPPERRLAAVAATILIAIGSKAVLGYAYGAAFGWLDARVGHRIRTSVFERLLLVEYGFIEKSDHGELLNTLGSETWRTAEAVRLIIWMAATVIATAFYVAFLLVLSWPLTLLTVTSLAVIAGLLRLLNRRVRALGEEATVANERLAARMLEGLGAMAPIRTFGRESYEHDRFAHASDRVSRTFFRLGLTSGILGPTYEVLSAVLLVGVLLLGVQSAADLPVLFVFIVVLYRLQPKVQGLDGARLGLVALAPAVSRVTALLRRQPAISTGDVPFEGLRDAIRYEEVQFSYDPAWPPALHGLSFDIPARKTTAIVGPSGAGKSTVIKLLLRLYDPDAGRLLADGIPLNALALASWREQIAVVSQDVFLFNTSVRDNIAYGREGATDTEVETAALRAHADGFIRTLADGYDTLLGERGARLSGGQRQRLALARAFVRNPDIVLLDEATNALDTLTEHVVTEALDEFGRDRTVVVVAHRLSTIERADHVVVLDDGRVAETGSFDELLAAGGLFAQMHGVHRPTLS